MTHKPKLDFKKELAVFLAVLVFFSMILLPSCNSNESENTAEPETTVVSEDVLSAAKAAYCEELSQLSYFDNLNINNVGGVFLFENTADGIPFLAISIPYSDTYPSPDIVYKYVDGEVIEINPESAGTGGTVRDEFWFVDGTDIVVYRYFGNSMGTFGSGKQIIYSDFINGGCSQTSQMFSVDWHYSDDSDIQRAQDEMRKQMDAELLKKTENDFKLISFKDSFITTDIDKYLYDNIGFTPGNNYNSDEAETETEYIPKTKEYYVNLYAELYRSKRITESRFSTIDEMADFYLKQWTINSNNKNAEQIIDGVDFYVEDLELIKAATVSYILDKGYTLHDFEDEFFYIQVSLLNNESEMIDIFTSQWLEDLFHLFPEDFNKFSIIKAYTFVAKEVVTINCLANGEEIVDYEGHNCVVTKKIAELSYETFASYYPIHEYFGIIEKTE